MEEMWVDFTNGGDVVLARGDNSLYVSPLVSFFANFLVCLAQTCLQIFGD